MFRDIEVLSKLGKIKYNLMKTMPYGLEAHTHGADGRKKARKKEKRLKEQLTHGSQLSYW